MALLSRFRMRCSAPKVGYGPVLAALCCLLVAVAVLIGVHHVPACVHKVAWAVMSWEGVVLELLSVILLVTASISVLAVVGGTLDTLTEGVVAFIVLLYNTALVDLVRRLCCLPGRCFWLTVLVLPFFLLALFVMCQWKTTIPRKST